MDDRLPTSTLKGMTPYEAWWGVKPSIDRVRVWGCQAYVFKEKTKRKTFEPKSKICTFIGYEANSKVWRFWDPSTRKVIKSRNAVFDEVVVDDIPKNLTSSKFSSKGPHDINVSDSEDDDDNDDERVPLQGEAIPSRSHSPLAPPRPPRPKVRTEAVGEPRQSRRERRTPDPEFYKVKNPQQYRNLPRDRLPEIPSESPIDDDEEREQ